MAQFAAIRRDARVEGLSIRALADRHGVHRRTVRQALESAIPPPRRTPARSAPRLEPFKAEIDKMLRSDLDAPRKQRHTARRVLARLADEYGASDMSYSTVRDYVAKRRPEILAEAGKPLGDGHVPQTHPLAAGGEVDFHDLWVVLRGVKTKTALFTMRLSYSARAAPRAFLTQGQEAFLEGHVHAFDRFGGIPLDKIRYDNLNSAVKQVLFGRTRQENERWIAFKSHYGFESWYCLPGTRAVTRRAASRARAAGSAAPLFARGADFTLRYRSLAGFTWSSDWQNLGGSLASPPSTVSWGPERLDVFAVGVSGGLPGRQGRLLFTYLVVNRHRHVPRDELAEALWRGPDPAAVDARLNPLLSKLRRVLGADAVDGRSTIRLCLPIAWVDLEAAADAIHRAESSIAQQDWARAWPPALTALFVAERDCLPGEDAHWIDQIRHQLTELHLRALECYAAAGLGLGGTELAGAVRAGRQLTRLAPLRESGYRYLMRALAAEGNMAEALGVYGKLSECLRDQLGVSPSPATRELYERLLAAT